MTNRIRLIVSFLMAMALFATQAQAQTLSQAQQTAYANLVTGLQGNATANEAADETLVEAARNAGLPDTAIAGALSSTGRSSDAITRAMLPAAPTQAQVNDVATALINATDGQGSSVNTGVTNANVSNVLRNAAVPINLVANYTVAPPAPPTQPTRRNFTFSLTNTINTLPATATGQVPNFQPAANTLAATVTSSGPNIEVAAVTTNTPIIPVTTTSLQDPEPIIPLTSTLHLF